VTWGTLGWNRTINNNTLVNKTYFILDFFFFGHISITLSVDKSK